MTSTNVITAIIEHFPEEDEMSLTAYPIHAYPGDTNPAWCVSSSRPFIYFADDVAIEQYSKVKMVRL